MSAPVSPPGTVWAVWVAFAGNAKPWRLLRGGMKIVHTTENLPHHHHTFLITISPRTIPQPSSSPSQPSSSSSNLPHHHLTIHYSTTFLTVFSTSLIGFKPPSSTLPKMTPKQFMRCGHLMHFVLCLQYQTHGYPHAHLHN